jgi:Carboxypeptidase regulatory-like domain
MHSRIEALATRPGRIQTTQEGVKMQGSRESWAHKWRACVSAIVAVLALVACSSAIYGQSGAGSIQGTVTDSTGAVIQGASIHIVNQATNVAEDTKSNDVGFYVVPDLFVGTYSVTVSAPSMKTYVQTTDLLGNQTRVINPVMTPGAVSQQVDVKADLVQLTNTESGEIGATIENQRINQLPMNQRNLLTLAANSVPGLESGELDMGLEYQGMEYVADGVALDNDNFGGQQNTYGTLLPDADSIQEVSFNLIAAPAQFASPGTGIITTKSGTNQLHGSFFETAVNSYWGVAKVRSNPGTSGYVEPQYIRNEFGGSAGGPIIVPWLYHGKDKSFWFFAYERLSIASVSFETVAVPTLAERGGDFSGMSSSGVLQTIYDPSTTVSNANCGLPAGATGANTWCRTQYAYQGKANTINPALISPIAKTLYAITQQPTNSNNPIQTGNLVTPNKNFSVIPNITFRLDHNFSEKDKAYLRYTQVIAPQNQRNLRNYPSNQAATIASSSAPGFPDGASGYQVIPISNFGPALGYTHVFSPTFYAETVLSQQWFDEYVGGGGNPKLDYDNMLGLPNNFGETGFPVINGTTTNGYGGTMYQYQENQIVSEIDENLTKVFGKHQMQFGGRFRHSRFYYLNSRNADTTSFTTYSTALEQPSTGTTYGAYSNTGLGDAGEFLGNVASASVQLQDPPTWFVDKELDGYFEDHWHLSKNLTVDVGLRYEAHPARTTRGGVNVNYDLRAYNPTTGVHGAIVLGAPISQLIAQGWTTQAIITNMQNIGVTFETASQAGMPSSLYDSADLMVSPRGGFAWQPFGSRWGTVLRGAYGRFIMPVPTRNSNPGPTSLPFSYGYTQNYNAANQSPDGLPNYPLRANSVGNPNWIVAGVNATGVVNSSTLTAITPGSVSGTYWNQDYKPSVVTQTGVTLEQPFKWNSALRVSWAWTHGSYLDHAWYPNQPLSTFVWEMDTGTAPPNGGASAIGTNQYAATALGPYDNITYGNFNFDEKTGWSNDNELQVNYERKFEHGMAFQIFYTFNRAFRIGSNSTRDGQTYDPQSYLGYQPELGSFTSAHPVIAAAIPSKPPTGTPAYEDWHDLIRWERYQRDATFEPHHIVFNYVFDLPVGRGKKFLGNSNRIVDELVGGYQIAGVGHMNSMIFQPGAGNWGSTSPIQVYKHKQPITDCRSGNCYPAYLWFNGYIPPTQNASSGYCNANYGVATGASGAANCIYGLPTNYQPYEQPINTTPPCKAGCTATNDGTNYNTNNVTVNLLNGTTQTQGYGSGSVGINPYSKSFIQGPKNWEADASLFKVFPITERYNLRFNMDVFNFLNHQGFNNPNGTDGTEQYWPGGNSGATSYNPARQVQLTLRLSF